MTDETIARTSKKRVTLQSNRFGEFDLDELVDRLCHSHAPKPREEDLYNAQVAILKLAEMLRAAPETRAPQKLRYFTSGEVTTGQSAQVMSSKLYQLGYTTLIWANIEDLKALGEPVIGFIENESPNALKANEKPQRYWMCSCKPPGNINIESVSVCKDCGTVRPAQNGGDSP